MLQWFRFFPQPWTKNFQPGTASPLSKAAFQTDLKDSSPAAVNFEMLRFWWKPCLLCRVLKCILGILP